MHEYWRAKRKSEETPDVIFTYAIAYDKTTVTGTIMNGVRNGIYTGYYGDGVIGCRMFYKDDIKHGECMYYDKNGELMNHYFNVNNTHMKDLNDIVNEPRDESFYFTLSLYGIDKEHTIG